MTMRQGTTNISYKPRVITDPFPLFPPCHASSSFSIELLGSLAVKARCWNLGKAFKRQINIVAVPTFTLGWTQAGGKTICFVFRLPNYMREEVVFMTISFFLIAKEMCACNEAGMLCLGNIARIAVHSLENTICSSWVISKTVSMVNTLS